MRCPLALVSGRDDMESVDLDVCGRVRFLTSLDTSLVPNALSVLPNTCDNCDIYGVVLDEV